MVERPNWLKKLYPFSSHFLHLGEHRLHYIDEGQGDVVLLLHGNPTWSFLYRNLVKELAKTHRVIALDHLGCGFSDKPQITYDLNLHIRNLTLFIERLGLKKLSLGLHDWGGPIGLGWAVHHPRFLQKLIFFNTSATTDFKIPRRIAFLRNNIGRKFLIQRLNLFAWPATWMSTQKKLSQDVKQGYLFPYKTPSSRMAISEFVRDIPFENSHPSRKLLESIEQLLPQLLVPKLILWGKSDFCFSEDYYRQWLTLYPDAEAHLLEGGHNVLEDCLGDVVLKLRDFL